MKKNVSALGFATFVAAALLCGNVYAANEGGVQAADVAAFSAQNHGQVLCTAFVNSNGSRAGGTHVTTTSKVGVGQYNVRFSGPCSGNIRINNGWARWVQPDTLQFGTTDGHCTTADLAATGGVGGIWVSCFNGAGAQADRSFSLFVAR